MAALTPEQEAHCIALLEQINAKLDGFIERFGPGIEDWKRRKREVQPASVVADIAAAPSPVPAELAGGRTP